MFETLDSFYYEVRRFLLLLATFGYHQDHPDLRSIGPQGRDLLEALRESGRLIPEDGARGRNLRPNSEDLLLMQALGEAILALVAVTRSHCASCVDGLRGLILELLLSRLL